MRYLAGLMLLVLAHTVSAIECRVNNSTWRDVTVYGFRVSVDVVYNAELNKIWLENYTMDCRHNSAYSSNPTLSVFPSASGNGVVLYDGLKGGLRVGDTNYSIPVPHGILLAVVRKEPYRSVQGRPYIDIPTAPGSYINIKAGAQLGQLNFTMFFSNDYGSKFVTAFVEVRARNALNLSPSTCTINNNNPINIDFGSIDPLAASGDIPEGTPYRRTVVLDYSCPDAGINSPIDIKFLGTPSTFNPRALATSNPDLATAMIHFSSLVPPGGSFSTNITNSSGKNTMLFTLFRRTGSLPKAGPFDASATLVLSPP